MNIWHIFYQLFTNRNTHWPAPSSRHLFTGLLYQFHFFRRENLLDIQDDDKLVVMLTHPSDIRGVQLRSNAGRRFDMVRIQI